MLVNLLVSVGQCWSVLVSVGQCWSVLVSVGQCWSVLVSVEWHVSNRSALLSSSVIVTPPSPSDVLQGPSATTSHPLTSSFLAFFFRFYGTRDFRFSTEFSTFEPSMFDFSTWKFNGFIAGGAGADKTMREKRTGAPSHASRRGPRAKRAASLQGFF